MDRPRPQGSGEPLQRNGDCERMEPDSAMYALFESRHGVPDLYFDDKPCNTAAARERGWNAITFTHADQLDRIGEFV